MNELNLERIQLFSPYFVIKEGNEYLFKTDYGIYYAVQFSQELSANKMKAYWFGLSNRSQKPSPNDPKVRGTIICIIEEFFRLNPDVLLYMCDNANDQQAMRSRLFLRWFHSYELNQLYYIQTAMVVEEDIPTYVAMIIQRSNPNLEEFVSLFKKEVEMFQEHKP